jgi:hypothetical protein
MPRIEKWSLKYDRCVNCRGDDVKHIARGLCLNCYQRETEKRNRGRKEQKQGIASQRMTFKFLFENYAERKRSLIDIAKECGCSRQYVLRKIRQFNIPSRTLKEARKLAYDRQKISYRITDENGSERMVIPGTLSINESFFKSWSNEMAYVLGVIYTDGYLFCDKRRKIYRFTVGQKYPELLQKVLNLMDCNAQLYHRKKHGISGDLYFFNVYHPKMYSDLINIGLMTPKSKNIDFPNIPSEFVRHFLRGCWDGDGSIYFESGKLRGSYTCGSFKFIEKIVQELYRADIYKRTPPSDKSERDKIWLNYPDGKFPLKIHEEKRSKSYYIKLDRRKNIEKLFHYFYDDVDESIYLTRKYNVFVKGLNLGKEVGTEQLTLDLEI